MLYPRAHHPRIAEDDEDDVPTQELDMLRPAAPTKKQTAELEAKAAENIVDMVEHSMLRAPGSPRLTALAPAPPNSTAIVAAAPADATATATPPTKTVGVVAGAPATPKTLIVHQETEYPEDVLAKKIANLLKPSIGDSLTKALMQKVEASLTADESKMESKIKTAAADAAVEAVKMAKHESVKTVTSVKHTPTSTVTTTVSGPADLVADGSPATDEEEEEEDEDKDPNAPVEVLAQPVHIEDTPGSLLNQIESIAVKKHEVDNVLAAKE